MGKEGGQKIIHLLLSNKYVKLYRFWNLGLVFVLIFFSNKDLGKIITFVLIRSK